MKKIFTIFILTFLLFGCTKDKDYDYEGSYALIRNESSTSLVIHWEYPSDDFNPDLDSATFDLTNLNNYIDESLTSTGYGPSLNNILGNIGYNRSYLHIEPILISEENISKIANKNIKIMLTISDADGNTYRVRLQYNKSIHA
ncbi:MAG: hypothetical protein ACI4U3_02445 [Traorella sp.]